MNKLLLLPLLLISAFVFGQGNPMPTYQQFGSNVTITDIKGAGRGVKGLIIGRYADTTTANNNAISNFIKFYPGAFIITDNPRDELWQRNHNATAWINRGSFNITTINFLTDSSVVFCFGNGVCDTISFTNNVFVTNNDNSITVFNDSTLIICSTPVGGPPVCDTLIFNIDSINNYFFFNDSTISDSTFVIACDTVQVICVGDSCYTQQVCDTIGIPRRASLILQNGLQFIAPGIGVFGHNVEGSNPSNLQYDTYLHTDYFQLSIEGKPVLRPPLNVKQIQWNTISGSVASFHHLGPNIFQYPTAIDIENPMKLYIGYTNKLWADTIGFMDDRIGYLMGTNINGNVYSFSLDKTIGKQSGIMYHTLDTAYKDAVTIWGNQTPLRYNFGNTPFPTTTLLESRIAIFKTDKEIQFPGYPNSRDDGDSPDGKGFYSDASGNLRYGLIGGGGSSLVALQNSLWVAKNGDDATGIRNRVDKPYLTIRAALNAASSGDVIIVWPGTYEEVVPISIAKSVNFQFMGKGELQLVTSVASGAIFTDSSTVSTSVIDAPGWTFTARSDQTVFKQAVQSSLKVIVDVATSITSPVVDHYWGSINIKANRLYTLNSFATVYIENATSATVDANIIEAGISGNALYLQDNTFTYVTAKRIFQDPTNGDYCIYNADSDPTDKIYIRADEIKAGTEWPIYINGATTDAYVEAQYIVGNTDCIVIAGATATLTVRADVIESTNTVDTDGIIHGELGHITVIGAKVKRNALATGYDVRTTSSGTVQLIGVSYDQTRVLVSAAGSVKRIDSLVYGVNFQFTNARLETDTALIVAANNLELGKANVNLTSGNTQITAIYTAGWQAGSSSVFLVFSGAPLVKNATAGGAGTATIILAGATDFQAAANDILEVIYDGTNWREVARTLAAGSGTLTAANNGTSLSGSTVQLGQGVAAVGNPAILLNHREIPSANFTISFNADAAQTNNILQTKNAAAAIRARVTSAASFSNTGGQTGAEIFGDGASVGGSNSVAIGNGAAADENDVVIGTTTNSSTAGGNVLIGYSGLISSPVTGITAVGTDISISGGGSNNVTIIGSNGSATTRATGVGYSIILSGTNSSGFGDQVVIGSGHEYSIALGFGATTTAASQFVVGATDPVAGGVSDSYWGRGVVSSAASDFSIQPTGGSGTNDAAGIFYINAAKSTGNATPGVIVFQTSTVGASGTTLQSLANKIQINGSGILSYDGVMPTSGSGGTDSAIFRNSSSGQWYIAPSGAGGGGLVTADNGLTANTATNVQLFGPVGTPATLLNSRYLDAGSFKLDIVGTISDYMFNVTNSTASSNASAILGIAAEGRGVTGVSTSSFGVFGSSTSGIGVEGISINNFGVYGTSTSGNAVVGDGGSASAGRFTINHNSSNTTRTVLEARRNNIAGAGANSIGAAFDFSLETTTTENTLSNQIISVLTDATHATRTSQLVFTGVNSATTQNLFVLGGNGQATLSQYGSGTFTGTATKWLAVTSAGIIIEEDPPTPGGGGAWNDITSPTGDQALTFAAGESSTWANSNTTEDLFTVNSSTTTTSSFFSLNRTGTALAAGNNIMELISSGANGTNAITATGLNISVTNTNATSGTNKALVLTASGATTANIALEVTAGYVGIGESLPQTLLQVGQDGGVASGFSTGAQITFFNNGSNTYINGVGPAGVEVYFGAEAGKGVMGMLTNHPYDIRTNNTTRVTVAAAGGVTMTSLAGTGDRAVLADANGLLSAPVSDFSVKKNIQPLNYGIEELMRLRPVSFEFIDGWKNHGEGTQIGFIAQDVQRVLPNSTFITPTTGKMGFNSQDLIPLLTKALQESIIRIENLENEVKRLKQK